MRHSMGVAWKTYFRYLKFSVPYGIMLIASNAILWYLYRATISAAEFLSDSMVLGIVGFLFFALIGYEYLSLPSQVGSREALDTIHGATKKLVLSQLFVLLFLLALWGLNLLGWQLYAYHDFQISYAPYLLHLILAIFLNCVLPGCIGLLLGALLALIAKRPGAYCAMLLFALLCSPIPSQTFANERVAGISVFAFFDWFAILAPNTSWIPDSLYGIAMEACRWALAGFWLFALAAGIGWKLRQGRRRAQMAVALALAFLALGCGARFALRGGDSVVRKDYRPDGTLAGEANYRERNPVGEEREANFSVERYNLTFTVHGKLKATAKLQLAQTNLPEYDFTLYHGYRITSITDESGRELSFTRDGDFLSVQTPGGAAALQFHYVGNGGKYYSNYQGIALPGYLPYYPMPGHLALWDADSPNIQVHTDFPSAFFQVTVHSPLQVASNLTQVERNRFEGTTDTVSLFAGLLEAAETAGIRYYRSPISGQFLNLEGFEDTWKALADRVGETKELSLTGKTIFIQPMTILASGGRQEGVAVLGDQALVLDLEPSKESICITYLIDLIPDREETELLKEQLMRYIGLGSCGNGESKPQWESLSILTKYASAGEIYDVPLWQAYLDAENIYSDLFQYQVDTLGEEVVLKAVYQYLQEPDPNINQIDFLYQLGG